MVSLDDAVLARLEKGGKRYEVLVDPVLVETFKETPNDVDINEFLAMDEVFHDARGGERPTAEAIENVFGTQDIVVIASTILEKGSIQLTTVQRKQMVENMRQQIVHRIHSQAVDPKTKAPHPKTRIELALNESRYSVDPFKRLEEQVKDAIAKLKPLFRLKRSGWPSKCPARPTVRFRSCFVHSSKRRAGSRTVLGPASSNAPRA